MEIVKTASGLVELAKVEKGSVLTIGNFDGVHIGHREIINTARYLADERRTELVLMTFEPHPLAVLYPEKPPGILTPLSLKKYLLAESGVDFLIVSKSTSDFLRLSAEDFVQRFLVENIQPSILVEGDSFNFGCGRGGSIQTLKKFGAEKGFDVLVVEAKEVKLSTDQTFKVSSTIIRELLASGKVSDAAISLGRPYRLIGKVIPGKGKGKQLGFPTVNMEQPEQLVPSEGVYAGLVEIGDSFEQICSAKERIPAVFSIGRTQTLGSDYPMLIEAHLLAEDPGDSYGKWLAMDFVKFIRHQKKFDSPEQLSEQIAKDCRYAKEILTTDFTD